MSIAHELSIRYQSLHESRSDQALVAKFVLSLSVASAQWDG
jgi:hypothetical protein